MNSSTLYGNKKNENVLESSTGRIWVVGSLVCFSSKLEMEIIWKNKKLWANEKTKHKTKKEHWRETIMK